MKFSKMFRESQLGYFVFLFCLALCIGLGHGARLEMTSFSYIDTDLLPDTEGETVTADGIWIDGKGRHTLLIGLEVEGGTGCIVTIPSMNLSQAAKTVVGACRDPRNRRNPYSLLEKQPIFLDWMHGTGSLYSDGPKKSAVLVQPSNINVLKNGTILFIDSRSCLRRYENQHVFTMLGSCGSGTALDYNVESEVIDFFYLEKLDLMVFSINNQGVSVLTRYMGHRQIVNPNKIQRQEGRVGESYGLVGAGGNSLYQKIDGGVNKLDFTGITPAEGDLHERVEHIISTPKNPARDDESPTIGKKTYGMASNPFTGVLLIVDEWYGYRHMYSTDLMTKVSKFVCYAEKGGDKFLPYCLFNGLVSPIWLDADLAIAFDTDNKKFIEMKWDVNINTARYCRNNPCVNGVPCLNTLRYPQCVRATECDACTEHGTCIDKVGPGIICKCDPGFTGENCNGNINDCAKRPCVNGGTCVDGVNAFTCECPEGWKGKYCEEDIPECGVTAWCANGGQCRDVLGGGVKCYCRPGFTGSMCETNINDCTPNPCFNGSRCFDGVNTVTCQCPSHMHGRLCQVDKRNCQTNTCRQRGQCKELIGGGYVCLCNAGWKGTNCDNWIDFCDPNPCTNGGTCTKQFKGFKCACKEGFTGKTCSEDTQECTAKTCAVKEACKEVVGGGTICIRCPPGLAGRHCEKDIDDCHPNPCAEGSTCEDKQGEFRCHCPSHMTGITCAEDKPECTATKCNNGECKEKRGGGTVCFCEPGYTGARCGADINECKITTRCLNGGTCKNLVNAFACSCPPAYTGKHCEKDVIDCDCDSCNGNGECKEKVGGGIFCRCQKGWKGEACEININDCKLNPCANKGICLDRVADYECVCAAGWTGKRCNDDIPECTEKTCGGHGECIEKRGGGVFCQCEIGYTGYYCATQIE